jgi:Uma2 family endonuclease
LENYDGYIVKNWGKIVMQVKETAAPYPPGEKVYTYEDYLKLPDDGNRYEIIEGELIMTPAPKTGHQRISRKLLVQLTLFVEKNHSGEVFNAPCDVVLSKTTTVQPDIVFISNRRKSIITEDNIQGAPDLIIEILSPATAYYDLVEKKELYEKNGVNEYWIVDPKKQRIEIYILEQGKYQLHRRKEKTGKINSKLLKGFEVAIKEVVA